MRSAKPRMGAQWKSRPSSYIFGPGLPCRRREALPRGRGAALGRRPWEGLGSRPQRGRRRLRRALRNLRCGGSSRLRHGLLRNAFPRGPTRGHGLLVLCPCREVQRKIWQRRGLLMEALGAQGAQRFLCGAAARRQDTAAWASYSAASAAARAFSASQRRADARCAPRGSRVRIVWQSSKRASCAIRPCAAATAASQGTSARPCRHGVRLGDGRPQSFVRVVLRRGGVGDPGAATAPRRQGCALPPAPPALGKLRCPPGGGATTEGG